MCSICSFAICDDLIRALAEATVHSSDVPLVPLAIARAMNPRPPSPTTAAETQRNYRREDLKQLSTRREVTLTKMQSIPSFHGQINKAFTPSRAGSISSELMMKAVVPVSPSARPKAPVRPPRDARRKHSQLEVRSIIPLLNEFIYSRIFYSGSPSLLLHFHANRTSSKNRVSSSGKMAIFRAHL